MGTLGELAFRTGHIYAQCMKCSHFAVFRVLDLKIKFGDRTSLELLERSLRCSNCGAQNAHFVQSRPTSNPSLIEQHKLR
jgi:uncharacterized Zn finger protein